MANTLTDLIPDAYEALDVVSREMVGYISAVNRNSSVERAALNQNVLVPITGAASTATNTPAVNAPDTGDQTVENVAVTISKSKHVPIRWNGEETRGLENAGTFSTIMADRIYQGMRALVNEIESDVHAEVYKNASRAYGATIGTAPFGTAGDLSDFAGPLGILEVNGAPTNDLQMVLGTAAMGNLRGKQSVLFKVNEAGSSDMLRNGMTDRVMNFALRQSAAVVTHTAGAGAGADINNGSGEGVGQTSLTVDGITVNTTGYKAGDLVTLAGDTNKYTVTTLLAATSGELVIAKPGLLIAAADATEITLLGSHVPNTAFARSAVVLATRAPAMPKGGDSADDVMTVTDPVSGLSFEFAIYRQFLQTVVHVRLAWGFKAVKPEHIAVLHG